MKFLISLLLMLFATGAYAQQYSNGNLTVQHSDLSAQWTEIHEQEGILFSAEIRDCNRPEDGVYQEMVFLKFVNTTNQDKVISFDLLLWYDGALWTRVPVSPEKRKSLVIGAGEVLVAFCDPHSDYYYDIAIFSRFLNYSDKPELTKFQLSNLKVTFK
ncbi:MAG: hypothetical protein JXR53_10605 [Bacteroidales bacterium]|nr:hypothetical protein [Bacteroidales bacterium]